MKEFDNLKLKGLSDYGNHLIAQSYIDFEELLCCAIFHKEYINLLEKYFGVKEIEIMVSTKHPYLNKKSKTCITGELIKTKSEQKFAIFNNQFSSSWKYDYIKEIESTLKTL
jgi:hypothetical protein